MEIQHEPTGRPVSALPDYQGKYPNIAFERREGVLQITLHQDGGEFVVSEPALRDLGKAFVDVAEDPANRVVILTGTGDRFATRFDYGSFIETMKPDIYEYWLRTRTDGVRLLRAFLDIEVPVISWCIRAGAGACRWWCGIRGRGGPGRRP
jgi:enoyl-CoA hydratase/carnithine racemase